MRLPLKFTEAVPVQDRHQRALRELRVSVIDRCNFRCTYCMPADSLQGRGVFLPLEKLLTDHEIVDMVKAFAGLGVRKLRITGGEPLLRPGLPALVDQLASIPGLTDIALTTNGVMLPRLADDLFDAGLNRLTVSLDTLDPQVLAEMSGGKAKLAHILDGIKAAEAAGFGPLKINTVVQKGVNDHTIMDLVEYFRGTPHRLRLIEYMDVGNSNHWSEQDVVPNAEWRAAIEEKWPLRPVRSGNPAETARRFEYVDGQGEIGFISSITQPFCGGCTRARVTADGIFYTCLFSSRGNNLMPLIRHSEDPAALSREISAIWAARDDRYSEERGLPGHDRKKVEMYRLGG
ncbi:MAG: GTP 3',8-cyclase MoaA [Xanthomonadales bacterium]|nr:GTP 3',8-cyclase MoaA [Gammaproteobacteria bacterium]MBT8052363.1 GTP 3',8-cyclase MoaA [Gammaproteobacteria bacterium]NND56527.1 GTP 3',8-cyclase MoaA [Xanthomonadales bacterium]NNK52574.1 GTP 3',8-cyclase MoaA [Xanthomonadales bacterium]